MSDVLVELRMTGNDSFGPDERWRKKLVGTVICRGCDSVMEGSGPLDVIVVTNRKRRTDLDSFSGFIHRVRVFSTRLIDIVGEERVKRGARLGRIFGPNGIEQVGHRSAVAVKESVFIRGSEYSNVVLCRQCGRLHYGPAGEQYVLRDNLPKEEFFISDGSIYCTNDFWERHFARLQLTRLEALEYPILDKPEDGLPASRKALIAYLRRRKRYV